MGAVPERPEEARPSVPARDEPASDADTPFDSPEFEEVEKGLKPSEIITR